MIVIIRNPVYRLNFKFFSDNIFFDCLGGEGRSIVFFQVRFKRSDSV